MYLLYGSTHPSTVQQVGWIVPNHAYTEVKYSTVPLECIVVLDGSTGRVLGLAVTKPRHSE